MRLTDIARAVLERVDPPRDIEDYKEKIKTLLDLEQYTKADPELMQAIKQAYQVLAKWKIQHDEEQKLVASEYEEEVPVEETNPIVDAYNQYKQALKQNNVREDGDRIDHRKHRGMPVKGHDYHYKNGDELRYIIKDAGEAAEAMRGHDETAEAKYLDQINDAATILGYRQKGGKRLEKNVEAEAYAGESGTGDPPISNMSREEMIHKLGLSAEEAIDFADEDLINMMGEASDLPPPSVADKDLDEPESTMSDIRMSDGPDDENFESDILSALKEIADEHQAERVKFDNGDTDLVDAFTASAAVKAYESLNPNLQPKAREFMSKSPGHLVKFVGIAMGESKYKKTPTVGNTIDIMREHFDDYEKDLSNRWYQYANYKSTRQKIAELSKRIISKEETIDS